MMTDKSGKTLADWRERIETEVDYVDVKPYSHNLISLALGAISDGWSKREANRAITDFGLDTLGWSKEEEESDA